MNDKKSMNIIPGGVREIRDHVCDTTVDHVTVQAVQRTATTSRQVSSQLNPTTHKCGTIRYKERAY